MDVVLGLDLGTTNCKVLALGEDAQPVAIVSAPTPTHLNARGEEYDAAELYQLCADLIHQVVAKLGSENQVTGIAVASTGEAGVLLDETDQPLAPIIAWRDKRTVPWVAWWRERISAPDLYRITGVTCNYVFSANKLLWSHEHMPALFACARSWLCLSDWIAFCLSGHRAMSFSLASRTMLFDLRARAWSEDLLRLTNLPRALLPPLLPGGQVLGGLTPQAARDTGLRAGTPVIVGGHDHTCAALAAGVVSPGTLLNSSGTMDVLLVALDAPILDYATTGGISCGCHSARERYYLTGGVPSGAVVDWLSRLFAGDDSPDRVIQLMRDAVTSPVGAQGVWFAPYLDGTGSVGRDPDAWGAWFGLRLRHTRADLVRAAMEGISFSIRHLLKAIQIGAQARTQSLRAVGGGARNAWWQQLKADVLGMPIETFAVSDVAAQGAALLAGIGVGMFANEAEAIVRAARPATRYTVDAANHAQYDAAYRNVFLKLYPALKMIALNS
jgi:xylulokinase